MRIKNQVFLSCFLFSLFANVLTAADLGYGDPVAGYDGYPSWQERALLVLTDACRMNPTQYRDTFVGNTSIYKNILLPANYPAVAPLYWNIELNLSARAHAIDMANNCGMQHNSCDGTLWNVRIESYYTASGTLGENIAYGYFDPLSTMRQWILDSSTTIAADKSGDGHRANIMGSQYFEIGNGYATGPKGYAASNPYWVQDFGGGASAYSTDPIPSGSHFFIKSGDVTFLVNYYDASKKNPSSCLLFLDNVQHTLTLELGIASKGTYRIDLPKGTVCRPYYFNFTDGNGAPQRYPANGFLLTQGEGSCTTDYEAQSSILRRHITNPKAPSTAAGPTGRVVVTGVIGRSDISVVGRYVNLRGSMLRPGDLLPGMVIISK